MDMKLAGASSGTAPGHVGRLFDELAMLPQGDPRWSRVRDRLVTGHLPVAERIARRIAAHLEIDRAEVLEGLEAGHACHSTSLDQPLSRDTTLRDTLGEDDAELARVDNRGTLLPLIKALSERERLILGLRFVHNMTQSQIAQRIGVSQVHVSRLLARTLERLREGLG